MAQTIAHDDARLRWPGAVALERTADWTMPWRLPFDRRDLFPPELLVAKAAEPAGVRIAFRSDTTTIAGSIEPRPETGRIDLCCDGRAMGSCDLGGRAGFRFEGLPPGEKRVELWLPQFGEFRLKSMELDDGATLEPFEEERPRWIAYGSSITQCHAAESPTRTWPAIVARRRGLDLLCLGFSGQCHLDPMIARLIRDLPADFISICVGINIYGAASLGPRAFLPALIGFISIVREKHPDVPFAVLSPIFGVHREKTPNAVGFTLEAMREQVSAAVDVLRAHGDGNLHYIDGLTILGPRHAHLLPDDLHPDAEGYRLMARNFLEEVVARVFPRR